MNANRWWAGAVFWPLFKQGGPPRRGIRGMPVAGTACHTAFIRAIETAFQGRPKKLGEISKMADITFPGPASGKCGRRFRQVPMAWRAKGGGQAHFPGAIWIGAHAATHVPFVFSGNMSQSPARERLRKITGHGPVPSGKYTSVASRVPPRIATWCVSTTSVGPPESSVRVRQAGPMISRLVPWSEQRWILQRVPATGVIVDS